MTALIVSFLAFQTFSFYALATAQVLEGCNVTNPEPTNYDEMPMFACVPNLQGNGDETCTDVCLPVGNDCSHCRQFNFRVISGAVPRSCGRLQFDSWDKQLGDVFNQEVNEQINCIAMKLDLATVESAFTSIVVRNGDTILQTISPTQNLDGLNAPEVLTTSIPICGFRDPSKPIVTTTEVETPPPGSPPDFNITVIKPPGAIDIAAINIWDIDDNDLGFSFQQVIACGVETPSPTNFPSTNPTLSPTAPVAPTPPTAPTDSSAGRASGYILMECLILFITLIVLY